MRVVLLAGITLAAWAALGGLAAAIDGPGHWLPGGIAMGLCLVPALGTLALAGVTENRSPVESLGVVLLAPLVRLFVLAIGGASAFVAVPAVKADPARFLGWVLAFYLITLAAETILLLSRVGRKRPEPTAPPGALTRVP